MKRACLNATTVMIVLPHIADDRCPGIASFRGTPTQVVFRLTSRTRTKYPQRCYRTNHQIHNQTSTLRCSRHWYLGSQAARFRRSYSRAARSDPHSALSCRSKCRPYPAGRRRHGRCTRCGRQSCTTCLRDDPDLRGSTTYVFDHG